MSCRSAAGEILGIVEGDRWLPATTILANGPRTIADLLAAGAEALSGVARAAAARRGSARPGRPLAEADLLAPVPRPGKVVAIGRNYREHAEEEGVEPPTAPLIFSKWPSSVVGHGAEIRWDAGLTGQVDYEAELAVVIGRDGAAGRRRRRPRARARLHLPQRRLRSRPPVRRRPVDPRKSLDTFCPMGPVLVTCRRARRRRRPCDPLLGRR